MDQIEDNKIPCSFVVEPRNDNGKENFNMTNTLSFKTSYQ